MFEMFKLGIKVIYFAIKMHISRFRSRRMVDQFFTGFEIVDWDRIIEEQVEQGYKILLDLNRRCTLLLENSTELMKNVGIENVYQEVFDDRARIVNMQKKVLKYISRYEMKKREIANASQR